MAVRRLVTMTIVLLALGMLSPVEAVYPRNHACCLGYTRKPLDLKLIIGCIEQSSLEFCRIDAIIFFTKGHKKVCATKKDAWVRRALSLFSAKLRNMAARPTPTISTTISPWSNTTDSHALL